MCDDFIKYYSGYKYQLAEDYTHKTGIYPDETLDLKFLKLEKDGTLTIRHGYAWDGPSGPGDHFYVNPGKWENRDVLGGKELKSLKRY